jgi:hypothetical protein
LPIGAFRAYHVDHAETRMARLFISQERLDSWNAENRVTVSGDQMTLVADGRSFTIRPAVRFLGVAGGSGDDPHALVGVVKDEEALAAMGADQYMNSVICGDVAYDVQCGFVGDPLPRGQERA